MYKQIIIARKDLNMSSGNGKVEDNSNKSFLTINGINLMTHKNYLALVIHAL